MPIHKYKCVNLDCKEYNKIIEKCTFDSSHILNCLFCGESLRKEFPLTFHVKGAGREIDGKDLGKVTQEKNEKLKQKWSGYSYEEQNLRNKVTKMAEEKVNKK